MRTIYPGLGIALLAFPEFISSTVEGVTILDTFNRILESRESRKWVETMKHELGMDCYLVISFIGVKCSLSIHEDDRSPIITFYHYTSSNESPIVTP